MIYRFVFPLFLIVFIAESPVVKPAENSNAQPFRLKNYGTSDLTISWQMPELQIDNEKIDNRMMQRISFDGCGIGRSAQGFEVPYSRLTIGVPDQANVSYQLSDPVYQKIEAIDLAPYRINGRDKQGISISQSVKLSGNEISDKQTVVVIGEQQYFRDLPVRHLQLNPIQYRQESKTLTILKSATIKIVFDEGKRDGRPFIKRAKLDDLYAKMVINFEQSRNWMTTQVRPLLKQAVTYDGPWYRFMTDQDGLYKISYNTLSAAGIDVNALDPRTIRLYNHGGKPLSPNTNDLIEGPVEVAIIVEGEEDGLFDADDYILFYGTGAGGWYYNQSENDFTHTQHAYDSKNFYLLTYGGESGRRMSTENTASGPAGIVESYFLERIHFEEDRYNLLESGTDWYGYQFFGKAHDLSQDYTVDHLSSSANPAMMKIKFKGGSGLKYLDDATYRYYFTVWLNPSENPSALVNNSSLSEEKSIIFTRNFISTDYLINGANSVYIQYTGNYDNCSAYLDWLEFYYPRDFSVQNNQLMFYTRTLGQVIQYDLSGFDKQDIHIYDISDPVSVKRLQSNSSVQGGNFSFNLDLSLNQPKRILVSSTTSNAIINVPSLQSYQPKLNLMDPLNSADLLIITHPSFHDDAQQIVSLRENGEDPLKGQVIDTDDIYFYFSSSVKDVIAIRNFIRYAYYNWSNPKPSYVLLFGDGHYDYRNIFLSDTNWVPPFEIADNLELNSRESDNFYVDINFSSSNFNFIQPDLAVGRLPVESDQDARRVVTKLTEYENERRRDGWQTTLTFVADDEVTSRSDGEWGHQRQTENMAELNQLDKFIKRKIYLSAYESVPGGFGRVKPEANQAVIDQLNEGTLLINYVGHGSPTAWAHESALDMTRDLNRIQNEKKLPLWIAATCDFGKYDNPQKTSFSEALIWQEKYGAIAVISSSRLVYSSQNSRFNMAYLQNLFPNGGPSARLGEALLLSTESGRNDQKYHLFGDPSMYLADPRRHVQLTSVSPDTLRALSKAVLSGLVAEQPGEQAKADFSGGAVLIVNDARYDSVNTGGPDIYTLFGPRVFKGEISVIDGLFSGQFIVPKSIRYHHLPTGRVTVYAWDEANQQDAIGYVDTLLFNGTSTNLSDSDGPGIDLYFEGQEDFRDGDLVPAKPVLVADIFDENGINLTQEVGHMIEIQIDDQPVKDITSFFSYDRNSYSEGKLTYYIDEITPGEHQLKLQAWDNLNNPNTEIIRFRVVDSQGLVIRDVVNYPNPFRDQTNFTFQLLGVDPGVRVMIKIYTISGRLIRTMDHLTPPSDGFNHYPWDGRDEDGDQIANGVYIYKVIVKNDVEQKEIIEKLVVVR